MGEETANSSEFHSLLNEHRSTIENLLVVNKIFLTCLVKLQLLNAKDVLRLERIQNSEAKNKAVIDAVSAKTEESSFSSHDARLRFLDALRKSGQMKLVAKLSNFEKELDHIETYQSSLDRDLKDISKYLKHEAKKAKLHVEQTFIITKPKALAPDKQVKESENGKQKANKTKVDNPVAKSLKPSRSSTKSDKFKKDKSTLQTPTKTELSDGEMSKQWKTKSHAKQGVFITAAADESSGEEDLAADAEVKAKEDKVAVSLHKAQYSAKEALHQLQRSRAVIEELHKSYAESEKRNAYLAQQLDGYGERVKLLEASMKVDATDTNVPKEKVKTVVEKQPTKTMKRSEDEHMCEQLLDQLMTEIQQRQRVLSKNTDPPPRENNAAKYRRKTGPMRSDDNESSVLRQKLEGLASELHLYTHQERQITHRFNVLKYQKKELPRKADQIDKELQEVQKELKGNDPQAAIGHATEVVDITKTERNVCYNMMCNIERQLKNKIKRLEDSSALSNTKTPMDTSPTARNREKFSSTLSNKLGGLQTDIRRYMDLQLVATQKQSEDLKHRSNEYEVKLKTKEREVNQLERKLNEATKQKDKYQNMLKKQQKSSFIPVRSTRTQLGSYPKKVTAVPEVENTDVTSTRSGNEKDHVKQQTQTRPLRTSTHVKQDKQVKQKAYVRPIIRNIEIDLASQYTKGN